MIELLKPLVLTHNYEGNQLFAMIDKTKKPTNIPEDTYTILKTNGKRYDSNLLIDEKNDIFVLTSVENKHFGVAKIQKQFYKSIMARAILN